MISSKINEPDRILIKQRELILKKHYEKLDSIRQTEPKLIPSNNFIHRSKNTFNIERKIEISRTNKILLSKISHIDKRKPQISKSAPNINKSLNINLRKKFSSKINEENERIAIRINSQKGLILQKRFEDEFLMHKKYKNQLSRQRLIKYQEKIWAETVVLGKKSLTPSLKRETNDAGSTKKTKEESSRDPRLESLTQRIANDRFLDQTF